MSLCVLMVGGPTEGFQLIGPFKQEHHAREWAGEWINDLEWWVAPLQHIEEFQDGIKEN